MKRRLRKKKRLGEFKELGFEVRGHLHPGLSGNDLEAFVERLIDVVEARSLAFGGGAGRDDKLDGFITRAGRGSATEEDRVALGAFLTGDEEIARHEVGALCDAWYGWDSAAANSRFTTEAAIGDGARPAEQAPPVRDFTQGLRAEAPLFAPSGGSKDAMCLLELAHHAKLRRRMSDLVFGGYLITRVITRPSGWGSDLLPPTLVTASGCLSEFFPDSWAFSWVKESADRAHNVDLFGLDAAGMRAACSLSDELLEVGELALYRFIQSPSAVRTALKVIAPKFEPVVLGVALERSLISEFVTEEAWGKGDDKTLVSVLPKEHPVPPGGTMLGYEPLGFEWGVSDAHSWVCNGLEQTCFERTGATPNARGLLDDFTLARSFCRAATEEGLGEPVLWLPWALFDFSGLFRGHTDL